MNSIFIYSFAANMSSLFSADEPWCKFDHEFSGLASYPPQKWVFSDQGSSVPSSQERMFDTRQTKLCKPTFGPPAKAGVFAIILDELLFE